MKNLSFFLLCFCVLSAGCLNAQTVSQLLNNYSGNATWNSSTGVLRFTTSGSIGFNQNGWDIPSNVQRVVIGSGVQVTGRFDWDHSGNIIIEGENKNTSVLFGTNQQGYASQNGGGDVLSGVRATDGDVTLQNFTLLNSKGFGFTHRGGGFMTVDNCRIIDNRGGGGNNSDGIVTWGGGLVKNCYIETADDNIKVYGDIVVEDTECHMILNAVPVQLGWGNYGSGATGTFRNFLVTGNSGRGNDGNAVIIARSGTYNKTLTFDGITVTNPNASLFSFRNSGGNFDITMTDADISVNAFQANWSNGINTDIEICGSTYGENTTTTSFNCTGGGTPSDITDLSASNVACDAVTLTWSDVNGETAYRVRRKLASAATFTNLTDVGANVTAYTDNSVAANTSYIYQVRPLVNGTAVALSNQPQVNTPPCSGISNGTYYLEIRHSNKYVDVAGASTANGANVQQWGNQSGTNKQWIVTNVSGEWYSLISVNSNKALDVANFSTSNGGNIQQWSYSGNDNQLWRFDDKGGGWYQIISKHSGKALDVAGGVGATQNGANIQQWTASNNFNQQFRLISTSGARLAEERTEVLEEIVSDQVELTMYPNPVINTLHLKGAMNGQTLHIFDVNGSLVLKTLTSSSVDISAMKAGLYVMIIDGQKPIRFIKK